MIEDTPLSRTVEVGFRCDPSWLSLPSSLAGTPPVMLSDVRYHDAEVAFLFWVADGDVADAMSAMADWSDASAVESLSTDGCRTLIRVSVPASSPLAAVYDAVVKTDAILTELTGSVEGWEALVKVPSHAALSELYGSWVGTGLSPEVGFVRPAAAPTDPVNGLTDYQRQALIAAAQSGYYDVPRRATLGEIAPKFDISDQALSERIRRGTFSLIRGSVRQHMNSVDDVPEWSSHRMG